MAEPTGPRVACLDGLNLVMPFSRPVTAEEWNDILWPPCPRCGATICVDRLDVTMFGQLLRHYVAGRWECPNECDPRAADETRSLIQGFARARQAAFPDGCPWGKPPGCRCANCYAG